jgi:hypothetical protein
MAVGIERLKGTGAFSNGTVPRFRASSFRLMLVERHPIVEYRPRSSNGFGI